MDRRIGPQVPKATKPKMASSNKPMQLPKIENKIVDDEWRIYDSIEPPDTLTEDDFEYFQFIDREKRKREKMIRLRDEQELHKYQEIRKNLVINTEQTLNFDSNSSDKSGLIKSEGQEHAEQCVVSKKRGMRIIRKINNSIVDDTKAALIKNGNDNNKVNIKIGHARPISDLIGEYDSD